MQKTLYGLLLLLALVVFIYLQYNLWMGEGGIADVNRLKQDIAAQKAENARLADRNRVLEAEVKDLKTGNQAVEEHARQDLGMIKSNETFYLVTAGKPAPVMFSAAPAK